MAKHGGHLSVESKPGEGAVFTLHFPAANVKDISPEQKPPALAVSSGKILIMEDEPFVAKVLKRMLERLGYQAASVGNGEAALDAYRQALEAGKPYSMVIMDLIIPGGIGGKETIGKLKEIDRHAKAVVSSGYPNDPIMAEYAANGFSGVLAKPYCLEEVSEVLRRIIGSTRS